MTAPWEDFDSNPIPTVPVDTSLADFPDVRVPLPSESE